MCHVDSEEDTIFCYSEILHWCYKMTGEITFAGIHEVVCGTIESTRDFTVCTLLKYDVVVFENILTFLSVNLLAELI